MSRSTPDDRPDEPPQEPNRGTRVTSDPGLLWDASGRAGGWPPRAYWDLAASAGLLVLALIVALTLPEGSVARAVVALPALLIAPGYLLLQALLVPARQPPRRLVHALLALGISPPLLGLLALSTVMLPGGFTAGGIFAMVTFTSLLLAAIALVRRARFEPDLPYTPASADPAS